MHFPRQTDAHKAVLDAGEVSLAAIKAGKDADLVEAMAAAAHQVWRELMGQPLPWDRESPTERDAIRLGVHAALLAARRHASARRAA